MGLYHRLVQIADLGGVDDMEDELTDRFGPLPLQAQNLLFVLRLKLRAARAGIKSIARGERRVVLHLEDEVGGAMRALQRTLGPGVEVGHTQIRMDLNKLTDAWQEAVGDTVQALAEFRERMVTQVAAGVA